MAVTYYEKDAKLELLKGKTVAIIGYGIQGRSHALCLRDSGVQVVVADLEGTVNWKKAKEDGWQPTGAAEAAKKGDIIAMLTEDNVQARVYREAIAPNLRKGDALLFAHGFNIHYHQILPRAGEVRVRAYDRRGGRGTEEDDALADRVAAR